METAGVGHGVLAAIDKVIDSDASTPEKILAVLRLRYAEIGIPPAETQMMLASISHTSYGRHSRKADQLIAETGFVFPEGIARLPRAPRPKGPYIKRDIDNRLRWQIFRRDGYACQLCGELEDLTVDHIESEKSGGETVFENLRTLCRPCNSRKGAKNANG